MYTYVYVVSYIHTYVYLVQLYRRLHVMCITMIISSLYKFVIKIQDYKLCSAAKAGNIAEVKTLIQSGAHVDSTEVSLHNCKK